MKTTQNPRRQWTPAQYIRALDLAAKRSTVAAIAVGFRRITQLVFAHNPARTVTLGRLIYAGGVPFGIVGYHNSDSHAQQYHQPFPDWAGNEAAQVHLGLLSSWLLQGLSICYASMPVPPPDRAPWTRSPAALIPELERHAATLARAAITVALDTGPSLVFPHEADWPTTLSHLVDSGGTPIGVVGFRSGNGNGENGQHRFQSCPFPEYADTPWALDYLQGMADVLDDLWRAGGADLRLVAPAQRPACSWTLEDLVLALESHAHHLIGAAIVVVLDRSTDFVFADDLHRLASLARLISFGGTPIGVIGYLRPSNGQGCQAAARPFPEYAQVPWVQDYLAALCDRLRQHLKAAAINGRRERSTHTQLEFGIQAVKDALTHVRP